KRILMGIYLLFPICSVAKPVPFDMLINSREMAGELTEVYIKNLYGVQQANEKPYNIKERNDSWEIEGTPSSSSTKGGNFVIVLSKIDGAVLFISHGK
ncbi:TPA: NTF2 fold immunity protein, partial [Salmonella enterica subsp. enterica serovar Wangata]